MDIAQRIRIDEAIYEVKSAIVKLSLVHASTFKPDLLERFQKELRLAVNNCEDIFIDDLRMMYLSSPSESVIIFNTWISEIDSRLFSIQKILEVNKSGLELEDTKKILDGVDWVLTYLGEYCPNVKIESNLNWYNNPTNKSKPEIFETTLDEIEITKIKERVRLFYELGLIDSLRDKYKYSLGNNNNKLAQVLAKLMSESQTTLQPYIRALVENNIYEHNYPKLTSKIEVFLSELEPK